jgi:hypothetical protein
MPPAVSVSLYRLAQNVVLGVELDSFVEDGVHGLCPPIFVSFDPKIIKRTFFNNQGNTEYEMRTGRFSR